MARAACTSFHSVALVAKFWVDHAHPIGDAERNRRVVEIEMRRVRAKRPAIGAGAAAERDEGTGPGSWRKQAGGAVSDAGGGHPDHVMERMGAHPGPQIAGNRAFTAAGHKRSAQWPRYSTWP